MGNPDGATPAHIVAKLTEVAQRPDTHGYSASRASCACAARSHHWYKRPLRRRHRPGQRSHRHHRLQEGLAHLMLATLDRGDTVLVPDPSYPIHIYGAR